MLYIIEVIGHIVDGKTEVMRYKALDTLSASPMLLTPDQLKTIFSSSSIQVANATIQDNEIKVSDWVNNIGTYRTTDNDHKKYNLILLSIENDRYKITDYRGDMISEISFTELAECIDRRDVANCTLNKAGLKIRGIDTYEIISDEKFKATIASKYETFIAKSRLLGYGDISFDYEIENKQVRLRKYTGSSANIILPYFITAIADEAFSGKSIEKISLNEGLAVIGRGAFASSGNKTSWRSVEIPSTVELIGRGAFYRQDKLLNVDGTLNMDRVKLRNIDTIITR